MPVKRDYFVREIEDLTGLSRYMIGYLDREGIVKPTNSRIRVRGKKRRYTFQDVVLLRIVKDLLNQGISVKRLKEAISKIRKDHVYKNCTPFPFRYLVANGKDVLFKHESQIYEDLKTGQFAFSFIVDAQKVYEDIRREALKRYF